MAKLTNTERVVGLASGQSQEPEMWDYPPVSVVVPCRNERNHIYQCVGSILSNGYPGKLEIIVVDGMSDDGTREALQELEALSAGLRVLDNPSRITPVAMNLGFQSAQGDVVLIVGAHCELGPRYISTTITQLVSHRDVGCVGGRTSPQGAGGATQSAMAAVLESRFGVGNSYFRIPSSKVKEVDTVAFGAYRREIFQKVGGFNERLVRNQDIEFNYRLRKAGYRILLDPSVEAYYRPRRSIKEFWKQNFGNGYWNIITWRLVPGSLSWRHFVPLLFVTWLFVFSVLGMFSPAARVLTYSALGSYGTLDALESMRIAVKERKASLLATFLVFPVLHVSYGLGSICGILSILFGKAKGGRGPCKPASQRS